MKLKRLWIVFILFIASSSQAFLNDNDPKDFFSLLEKTPTLVVATLQKTQGPAPGQNYFVHSLKIDEVLKGSPPQQIQVLQEAIFPGETGLYPAQGAFLAFLAPLPNYTAYAKAKSQGVEFRSFGGPHGVLALKPENKAKILNVTKNFLKIASASFPDHPSQKRQLLFEALSSSEAFLKNDAAVALAAIDFQSSKLRDSEVERLLPALENAAEDTQLSLILILQKSANPPALAALKKLAEHPQASIQWPTVRALENLGMPRPSTQLVKDYPKAAEKDRRGILVLLARRNDAISRQFLEKLLQSDTPLNLKKEIILRMAEVGGKAHEAILLKQLEIRQEEVVAQSLVVLAGMQSAAAVDKMIALLDSPSSLLKRAAQIALEKSQDPRAVKAYRERFGEKQEVHVH